MKGKDLPRYVTRQKRDGALYFVKRYGGQVKKIRLQTQFAEGEPVPFRLHQEIERLLANPVAEGETLAYVIGRYQRSQEWRALAPRTRKDYIKRLDYFSEKMGHLEPIHIERRHVISWRDAWADQSPHEANYKLRVLKIILERSIDYGLLKPEQNPAKKVPEVKYEKRQREPWPVEMVAAARSKATDRTALLFELLLGSGQRIGDVLSMRWADYDGQAISVRQNKTDARLWVPVTDRLRDALDGADRRSVFILTNHQGTDQWSYRGAADAMMKLRRTVGAEAYDIHSLRYTATAELARLGLTDEQIMSVTGHKTVAMVQRYAGPERQKARAIEAQRARDKKR